MWCELHSAIGSAFHCRPRDSKFESQLGHVAFIEINHEIISTVIIPLPLIQEGQRKAVVSYW